VRTLVLVEPLLATLLRDAGDLLFDEYHGMAEGFVHHTHAGRDRAAWELFLDYRNGPGTWAGMAEKAKARFLGAVADVVEKRVGVISGLFNEPGPALSRRRRSRHGTG